MNFLSNYMLYEKSFKALHFCIRIFSKVYLHGKETVIKLSVEEYIVKKKSK